MLSAGDFFDLQCLLWPKVAETFKMTAGCLTRQIRLDSGGEVRLLYNPARTRSTTAKVDAESIRKRPCFLCPENRPEEQIVLQTLDDWGYEILVNPYPILNPHFTIVAKNHRPQIYPHEAMVAAAQRFPDLVFFYNGAKAGASAPDHLHFQSVRIDAIPLLLQAETAHRSHMEDKIWCGDLNISHPAGFYSFLDASAGDISDNGLINVFTWKRKDGRIQTLLFPRLLHRPDSYPEPMISPGALDVAGLIVTVREQDFKSITPSQISEIFNQTCKSTGKN